MSTDVILSLILGGGSEACYFPGQRAMTDVGTVGTAAGLSVH